MRPKFPPVLLRL